MFARLVWIAGGSGSDDTGVALSVPFDRAQSRERRTFELQAPSGPYSYKGKLFSIEWVVEISSEPGGQKSNRAEIVIGPGAEPLAVRA